MTDVARWAAGLSEANIVTETEVRSRVAMPLLRLLGYPEVNTAEEFPVFGHEGRNPLNAKRADVLVFDSDEHHLHRNRAEREWVEDHALLAFELKRPGESLEDARGQAQFYARWAKTPFYALTDGVELVVFRMQAFFDDVQELACPVAEIGRHWARLRALLGYERVLGYCAENRIKSRDLPASGYSDYLRALYAELTEDLGYSMERTVSSTANDGADFASRSLPAGGSAGPEFAFPIGLSGQVDGESWRAAPHARLLDTETSVVVLSEPGGGKTRLTQMLAMDLARATQDDPTAPVPVILRARTWSRQFGSASEGVSKEVESFAPGTAPEGLVAEDLAAGRFVVLVDGLDEAPRDEADGLRAELARVAGRTASRLLVTCRRQDYRGELRGYFGECSIDPLTDEQVAAFAARELAGVASVPSRAAFVHRLGKRLTELVRTPLFLVMTVEVMKRSAGALPENRAELYRRYAHVLLTEWELGRLTNRPFEVDARVKAAVLSEYARMTWRLPPNGGAFAEAVMGNRELWDGERVRDELLRSGLLRPEADGLEFFHPSFREYFFALGLAGSSDEELARFAEENSSDDALTEVFAFLTGLLEDEDRQALVLDRLERGNLYVFGRCLRTRARFGGPEELPDGHESADRLAERYLAQLRSTHVALVDAHFGAVKKFLPPWRSAIYEGAPNAEEIANREVAVSGYLDTANGLLGYELKTAANTAAAAARPHEDSVGDTSGLVTLGLDQDWGPGTRRYRNLRHGGAGLDSARETAFDDLTGSVEKLLKKKGLPLGDNHPLGVEYVEAQLRKLRNNARQGWVPEDFKELSLRRSLPEVVEVMGRYLEEHRGPVTFAWERDASIGGFIETPVNFPRIVAYLRRLEESGLDPVSFLPPQGDLSVAERSRRSPGRAGSLVDKGYSDEAIALYIGRHYDLCQSAYRWIAENHFPSLKEQLGLYRVGPVRHRALIFRNLREEIGFDRQDNPSWVFVDWEPVASEAEVETVCEVTHDWPSDDAFGRLDPERYARTERALRELGRASTTDFAPMWSRRSHALTNPMGLGMHVHDEVYKQLEGEIVKQLMRGKGGRLP